MYHVLISSGQLLFTQNSLVHHIRHETLGQNDTFILSLSYCIKRRMLRTELYCTPFFNLFTDAKFSVWYRWTDGNVDWSISVNSCGVIGVNCNSAHYNVQNIHQEKRSSVRYKAEWNLCAKPLKYDLKRDDLQFYNNCRNSRAQWLISSSKKWTDTRI